MTIGDKIEKTYKTVLTAPPPFENFLPDPLAGDGRNFLVDQKGPVLFVEDQ